MEIKLIQAEELWEILTERIAHALEGHYIVPKESTPPEQEYLSLKQLCALVGKSRATVISWRKKGLLPIGKRIQNSLYFSKQAVLESLEQKSKIKEGTWKR